MENKNFFPLFVDLNRKKVLVIGAGKIAYRKVTTLLEQGADIEVVTLEIAEEKFNLLKNIKLNFHPFEESMLNNKFLVVAATDNSEFNKKIVNLCEERGILVNNITSKIHMNCRFASVLETEDYTIGISAKGEPKKSKALKEKLQSLLANQ
ncbi:MAG: bifunctional precorrin-2 dehydrogenase/sirohydrochlorin ferrochelatase [Fusobacterium sp.]|uniref:precorrin-2 dehydrogenase/sirohydrochlorin ferrochelatase family protein n=1 Tax=Fusobacterium sp. TaxID=68766 RepID=UPI002941CA20|nr:bifunctional precorrin-2 dehydrogenase/sirohydrochlorin ferrochelatase [Fusobacterium sp.]MDY3060002.1 bifunctional precorrin-2 dehydrogenase/sirohydrochlorin ferrochelatase [Fusobacterium sp.]